MLLSEMFGVERGKKFQIDGYKGLEFSVNNNFNGKDKLYFKDRANHWWDVATPEMLFNIIAGAHDNIIHLPPPLTDEQREQLKAIYTLGGRWLAKDCGGETYCYFEKPRKDGGYWYDGNGRVNDGYGLELLCSLSVCEIPSKSDTEPFDITKALGVGE